MKKLVFLLVFPILFLSCSKDDDTAPKDEGIYGTWKVTSMRSTYLKVDNTPYRDEFITEDDVETDLDLDFVITKDSFLSTGKDGTGEKLPVKHGKGYIEVTFEGEKTRMDYIITGNTAEFKSVETDVPYFGDVIIPKIITEITAKK